MKFRKRLLLYAKPHLIPLLTRIWPVPDDLPHREILIAMWGEHAGDRPEQLWALVTKVRKKIEPDPDHPRYLLSEPWVGYQLVTEPEKDSGQEVAH